MTDRSVRAYGAVGATRAGQSRVRKQNEPRYGPILSAFDTAERCGEHEPGMFSFIRCNTSILWPGQAVRSVGGGRESQDSGRGGCKVACSVLLVDAAIASFKL